MDLGSAFAISVLRQPRQEAIVEDRIYPVAAGIHRVIAGEIGDQRQNRGEILPRRSVIGVSSTSSGSAVSIR